MAVLLSQCAASSKRVRIVVQEASAPAAVVLFQLAVPGTHGTAVHVGGRVGFKKKIARMWPKPNILVNCSCVCSMGALHTLQGGSNVCVQRAVLQFCAASKCYTVTAQHSHYDSMLSTLHACGCMGWNAQAKGHPTCSVVTMQGGAGCGVVNVQGGAGCTTVRVDIALGGAGWLKYTGVLPSCCMSVRLVCVPCD